LRQERQKDLWNSLSALSPEERVTLIMKDVEGFSIEEIAAVTGRKTGTVKSSLHRTREKLYRALGGR
jgi:RNA polymerase sigma-70 factor (ECF subfamily)